VPLSEKEERNVIEGKTGKTKPNHLKTSYDSNWKELEKIQILSVMKLILTDVQFS